MRLKHSKIIGVITADSSNPFFAEVIRGIEETVKSYNYNILLVNTSENAKVEKNYIKLFCSRHVDGLLIVPVFKDVLLKQLYSRIDIPFLFLGRIAEGVENHSLLHEDYVAQSKVVEFLIKKGHSNILYISGPENVSNTKQRLDAYKDTLIKHGLEVNENFIIPTKGHIEEGYAAVNQAINKSYKFSAICCFNDLVAMGVLKSLKENHFLVPKNIEVFGFDNLMISQFVQPSLSTVDVPKFALGCEATHELMRHIEDLNLPYITRHLQTRLIFRESAPLGSRNIS
jgi:LacI family transcriptional regulator